MTQSYSSSSPAIYAVVFSLALILTPCHAAQAEVSPFIEVSLYGKTFETVADEQNQYEAALRALRSGNYDEAISAFSAFINQNPVSGYFETCLWWLASAQYGAKDYRSAILNARDFVSRAPAHPMSADALALIAASYKELRDQRGLKAAQARLLREYPDSEPARALRAPRGGTSRVAATNGGPAVAAPGPMAAAVTKPSGGDGAKFFGIILTARSNYNVWDGAVQFYVGMHRSSPEQAHERACGWLGPKGSGTLPAPAYDVCMSGVPSASKVYADVGSVEISQENITCDKGGYFAIATTFGDNCNFVVGMVCGEASRAEASRSGLQLCEQRASRQNISRKCTLQVTARNDGSFAGLQDFDGVIPRMHCWGSDREYDPSMSAADVNAQCDAFAREYASSPRR